MTVYVLFRVLEENFKEAEDHNIIVGVFPTLDTAQDLKEKLQQHDNWCSYFISKHTLDPEVSS